MNQTEATALKDYFTGCRRRVNEALKATLQEAAPDRRLAEALRYAGLGEGKRLRPILVFASSEAVGGDPQLTLQAACAVELIHSYSLAHDDLPAMDDDDLRRGRPSLHRAFDEATAILAGDALQCLAFEVLSRPQQTVAAETQLKMVSLLAAAAGPAGMVAGQSFDVGASGQSLTVPKLEEMHRLKTGALIRASVQLGALSCPSLSARQLADLERFADCIGLAFQVRDDILDVEGNTADLGKPQGSDSRADKPTYASLLGLEAARARAGSLVDDAREALAGFSREAERLRDIAGYIVTRPY